MLLALAFVMVAQEPAPEAAAVAPEAAPLAPEAAPLAPEAAPLAPEAAPLAPEAAPFAPEAALVAPDAAPGPAAPVVAPVEGPQFFDDGQPGHYLQWYGAEYVGLVAASTMFGLGAFNEIEPLPSSIGPSVNLASPDTSVLFDARLDGVIGKPILQEKVPNAALFITLGSLIAVDAGVDLAIRQDLHRTHAIIVGGSEAVLMAGLATEVMKLGFGRLRPDFRERWVRAACAGIVTKPEDLDCAITDDGFVVERKDLIDGMKSFPSGHASTSWAAATFVALQIGSMHLWGSSADRAEYFQPIAGVLVGGLAAGAGYITMTRVSDNRHHLEDVAVGSAIGIASGAAAYLIHFDLDGNARHRGSLRPDTLSVMPLAFEGGGAGAMVLGRF